MRHFFRAGMLFLSLACCAAAQGATHVWTGPANGLWSNNANWTGGKPTSGESGGTIVQFNTGSASIMDINGLIVDRIIFTGSNNVIGGTSGIALTISSSVLANNIDNQAGSNSLDFSLPVGLSGSGDVFFNVATGTLTLKSTISGTNNVRINTAVGAQVTYLGSKTYTGITGINNGTLALSSVGTDNAVAGDIVVGTGSGSGATLRLVFGFEIANTSSVTVNSDGTFDLNNQGETIGSLNVVGGLVSIGSGTLTLSGAVSLSSGTVSGTGSLNLGGNITATSGTSASASVQCPVSLNGNRTITVNPGTQAPGIDVTFSGPISNPGMTPFVLTKDGAGTLAFNQSASNTYSGGTNVNDGVLQLTGSATDLIPNNLIIGDGTGSAGSAQVLLSAANKINDGVGVLLKSDGLLNLNGFNESIDNLALVGGSVTLGAATLSLTSSVLCLQVQSGSLTAGNGGSLVLMGKVTGVTPFGNPTITSNITLGANVTFDIPAFASAPQLTIIGKISEAGGARAFTKDGTGTLKLVGSGANTYTGLTTINKGVVQAMPSGGVLFPVSVIIGNNVDSANSARLQNLGSTSIAATAAVTVNSSGAFDLNGFNESVGGLSGTGSVMLPATSDMSVNGDNASTTFGGGISGAGTFRKAGTGTLTLTGTNTLTGLVGVDNGTLALNSATTNACVQAATLRVGDGVGAAATAVLSLLKTNQITDATALDIRIDGVFQTANNSEKVGDVSVNQGTITIGGATLDVGNLTLLGGQINGGTLSLNGNVSTTSGTFSSVITSDIVLNATRTFTVIQNTSLSALQLTGVLKDGFAPSGFIKTGAGSMTIQGTGSLNTGASTCLAGLLQLNCSSTAAINSPLTIGNDTDAPGTATVRNLATADFASTDVAVNKSGVLDCNNFGQNLGGLSGGGKVMIGTGTFFVGLNDRSGNFSGVISGTTGTFNKAGTGLQVLSGNNTYTGTTFVNGGELTINGQQAGGVQVAAAAKLSGFGKTGGAFISGTFAPSGAPFSTGSITFAASAKLNLNLNSVATSAFSSVNTTGVVTINTGATLNLTASPGLVFPGGAKLLLISNDAADAIAGTFTNAPAGFSLTLNSVPGTLSYTGGTGNDFELTTQNVAPQIQSAKATPSPASAGQPVAFIATASDVNNDALTFSWDFGDNTQGSGAIPTHTYSQLGASTVTLVVSDGQGGTATTSFSLTINNDVPVITSATANPSPANAGDLVQFSATANDANNDALTFAWDFGDSTQGSGPSTTHAYTKSGAVLVTLTVSDGKGGTATQNFGLIINNSAPIITSVSATPSVAGVGQKIAFLAVATDINNDALDFSWDFGDLSTISGASVSHAYASAGIFTATVSVRDGIAPPVTSSVTVTVVAPIVGFGPDSDGDGFSDPFEIDAGTSPLNPSDTPAGGSAAVAPTTLVVGSASFKLNFSGKLNQDSIVFSGTLKVPDGFVADNQNVTVDVGGVTKTFKLDSSEKGGDKNNSLKLGLRSKNGVFAAQTAKYLVVLKAGNFASQLADEGLTNVDDKGSKHGVLVTLVFNKTVFQLTKTVTYKSRAGKSGSAH